MSDAAKQGACRRGRSSEAQSSPAGFPRRAVTLIPGEGFGAGAILAMRRVLDAARAGIEWEVVEAGERVRASGVASGLPWETIDSIQRTGLVVRGQLSDAVRAPGSTDRLLRQGFDVDSQAFWIQSLAGVPTGLGEHDIGLWLVRSSLRDLGQEVNLSLPEGPWPTHVPAGPVDERMFRRAFDLARQHSFSRVHCAVRTGQHGLLRVRRRFWSVATGFPEIHSECIDQYLLAQGLIMAPDRFKVVATSNEHGDIVAELASRTVGGFSYVGCAELGDEVVMFAPGDAVEPSPSGPGHPSPVGAIRAGILLLQHLRRDEAARRVERGLALVLAEGPCTDRLPPTREGVPADAFADRVIACIESERQGPTPVAPDRPAARLRRRCVAEGTSGPGLTEMRRL